MNPFPVVEGVGGHGHPVGGRGQGRYRQESSALNGQSCFMLRQALAGVLDGILSHQPGMDEFAPELRRDLLAELEAADLEPFQLWLAGRPGTGKR